MALEPIAVHRYAAALFGRAQSEGKLEALASEVREIIPLIKGRMDILRFFQSPRVPTREKRAFIERTLAGSEASQLDEFALLLLDKGRMDHFVPALEEFVRLEEEHRGFFRAAVTTAQELTEEERAELASLLERHTGHQLDITFGVDPDIIGGVIFRHRDEMIDSSLRSGLHEIGRELAETRVH